MKYIIPAGTEIEVSKDAIHWRPWRTTRELEFAEYESFGNSKFGFKSQGWLLRVPSKETKGTWGR